MPKNLLPLIAIALLTVIAYWPGLTGGFMFDDFPNILNNNAITSAQWNTDSLIYAAESGIAGPLKRPIPMISFALNFASSGMTPLTYKITNLIIHLLNGLLVYLITIRLSRLVLNQRDRSIDSRVVNISSLAVAAIWLLHPINVSTTLYVVQRMTSLASLFGLLAIYLYLAGRERQISAQKHGTLMILAFTPLCIVFGMLSKENAILVLPILGLIEICFFRFELASQQRSVVFKKTFWVAFCVGGAIAITLIYNNLDWLHDRYEFRSSSMLDRLLTEARVLWYYLSLVFVPRLTEFALFHDDFTISASLFEPMSTFWSVAGLALVSVAAIFSIKRKPLLAFAAGWFLIGHLLESSIIPLDLIYEHRNYFPIVGLLIGCNVMAASMIKTPKQIRLFIIGNVSIIFLLTSLTFLRASSWSDPATMAMVEARNHPNSFRSIYAAARIHYGLFTLRNSEDDYLATLDKLKRSLQLDNKSKLPLIALIRLSYLKGDEPEKEWIDELKRRFRETITQIADVSALRQFTECRSAGDSCPIPAELVSEIYAVAYGSAKMKASVKAQLRIDYAVVLINDYQANERAIALIDEAISLQPKYFKYRKMLITMLILSGDYDRAFAELDEIRMISKWKDVVRVSDNELTGLESRIARAAHAEPVPAVN